jgi:hypothetical protein
MKRSVRRVLLTLLLAWYAVMGAIGALLAARREGLLAAGLAGLALATGAAAWALWRRRPWAPHALLAAAAAGPVLMAAMVGTVPAAQRVPAVWTAAGTGAALWLALLGAASWWVGRRVTAA